MATSNGGVPPENVYGGVPGGITLPPYYKPTESVNNTTIYYPTAEELGDDEMRISFVGSCPWPPRKSQAGTCIMVELGNGKRFFFDFGPGCIRNIIAMQVAPSQINDIFLTHLHIDHYADLIYAYGFTGVMAARWKPLRVHGPSGRTPKDGTKHVIEHMQEMAHWHTDSFMAWPIGDGFEVEVNEFDFRDDGGVCYEQDGVTIRHWRRSHTKDGASAYRLDWNGLSFAWTGDGRPDELTAEYAKGCDVFVTEMQADLGHLQEVKMGIPAFFINNVIDRSHTVHYAAGYLMSQVQPRLAMVTHIEYDEDLIPEMLAGIRTHYKGFFQLGAPDVVVVNVQKDAIWTRMAAIADAPNQARPSKAEAKELFDISPTHLEIDFPDPTHSVDTCRSSSSATRSSIRISTTRRTSTGRPAATSPRGSRSRSRRWCSGRSKTSWAADSAWLSLATARRGSVGSSWRIAALAAGGILAMLTTSLMPFAHDRGGARAGIATAVGLAVALLGV